MSPTIRAYIYRVVTVAGLVAIGYGLVTKDEADLWLQLVGAILATGATGLAAAHTPVK